MRVILEFHLDDGLPMDAAPLLPERVLAMPSADLPKLFVDYANEKQELGDLCKIKLEDDVIDSLVLTGDTRCLHRAGFGMAGGRLEIWGQAGPLTGAEMHAGGIMVHGDAGDGVGLAMCGGLIRVQGNAGDRTGGAQLGAPRGMTGGMILVDGNAGNETAGRLRRGLVAVAGDVGEQAGLEMRAGTLLVGGRLGKYAGSGMVRGSIVAGSCTTMLPGFSPACRVDWTWLGLLFNHLKQYNFPVEEEWLSSQFTRYTGDRTGSGRGEIIIHDS